MGVLRGAHGRFAGSTRGGGGHGRSGGSKSRGSGKRVGTANAGHQRKLSSGRAKGIHRQRVGPLTAQSRRRSVGHGKRRITTYTYKVGKGGRVGKAPSRMVTGSVGSAHHNSFTRPGAKINSSTRFISRGHMVTRVGGHIGNPIGRIPTPAMGIGRAHSAGVVRRARKTGRLGPGYVVSYGHPLRTG